MKKILVLVVWVSFNSLWAAPNAIKMENQLSLQFMAKMLELLKDASPEQSKAYDTYNENLKKLLMDARAIQREHHLAEQRGLRGQNDSEKAHDKGLVLLEDAISETEQYLEMLLKGLKEHREAIKTSLIPKKE